MKITLVRHGQTENNFLHIIESCTNEMLNETGRRQCQRLKVQIKDKHYDYCYMSPLIKTVETAMILVGERVETIPDKRLVERDMGELEGRPEQEYNAFKFWDYDLDRNDYGVEPVKDLLFRCQNFLDYISEKHNGKDIIVVTHGETYRALRHLLLGHRLEDNLLDNVIDNCSIEEFDY